MESVWTLCGMGNKRIKMKIKEDCEFIFLEYSTDYSFRLDVPRRVLLEKKCVCDIEKIRRKYRIKSYFHFVRFINFHGYLLMFGFT